MHFIIINKGRITYLIRLFRTMDRFTLERIEKKSDWQHFRFVSFGCSFQLLINFPRLKANWKCTQFSFSLQIIFKFIYFFFIIKIFSQFKNLLTYLVGLVYLVEKFEVKLQTRGKNLTDSIWKTPLFVKRWNFERQ